MKEAHRLTFLFRQTEQQSLPENRFHLAIQLKIRQIRVLALIRMVLGLIQLVSAERLEQFLIHFHSLVFIALSQLEAIHMDQHAVMVFGFK